MDKTIRKVIDLKAQRLETYRYWQGRTSIERMEAVTQIVKDAYFAKGIDLEQRPPNRSLVRIERPSWKAI
jgi:hypothetical protein